MGYVEHFELEREPFSNAPDARFYFDSDQHSQALLRLLYSIDSNKGLAVLVGGIGMGKTTLARRLLDNLPESKYESSLLVMVHSGITAEWILTRIAMQLGVEEPASDRLTVLKQLFDRLKVIDDSGRHAVVLIDEAQMLQSRELMEEFRGLLNLELPGKKLLNIVFFGLSDLDECLNLDEPLAQRVAVKYHLRSLTSAATELYIKHRLQVARAKRMLFMPEAVSAIYRYTGGVPRLINTVCDNALFEAFLLKMSSVDQKIIHSVAGDLGLLKNAVMTSTAEVNSDNAELDEIENMLDQLERKA
ncbi:MAG: AAA family ATPase [Desulfuromonadaceae bacterium]|nr:AAA family ATPase [Desulfuromonadaceae bacterium]